MNGALGASQFYIEKSKVAKPFFQRLESYYKSVGSVLRGEASAASIFPNTTDIGISREKVYARVLKDHLPSSCNVYFGGFIFDMEGNESKQMDIIVINDKAIQFNFNNSENNGKSFSCIDGCISAVSIKSNLTSHELVDALDNISSIPNQRSLEGRVNPLFAIRNHQEWPFKIIFASDGISPEACLKTIATFYQNNNHIPLTKRPDLIHVSGKYVFIKVGRNTVTRDGEKLVEGTYHCVSHKPDEYGIPHAITQIQKIADSSSQIIHNYAEIIDKLPLE